MLKTVNISIQETVNIFIHKTVNISIHKTENIFIFKTVNISIPVNISTHNIIKILHFSPKFVHKNPILLMMFFFG